MGPRLSSIQAQFRSTSKPIVQATLQTGTLSEILAPESWRPGLWVQNLPVVKTVVIPCNSDIGLKLFRCIASASPPLSLQQLVSQHSASETIFPNSEISVPSSTSLQTPNLILLLFLFYSCCGRQHLRTFKTTASHSAFNISSKQLPQATKRPECSYA